MKHIVHTLSISLILGLSACSDDSETPIQPTEQPGTDIVSIAQSQSNLSTLVDLVVQVDLTPVLSNESSSLTVFAPTDDAFSQASLPIDDALVENILLHHVLDESFDSAAVTARTEPFTTRAGTQISVDATARTVGNAALSSTLDVEASNGTIHVLDEVMIPPDVLGAVQATSDLSVLASAVTSTSVASTLSGGGPITVFAPTNAGFGDFDINSVSQEELDQILTYHVVSGQILSTDIPQDTPILTASGKAIRINGTVITDAMGNTANIVSTDLRLLNGVVHLIDGVLIPQNNIVETAAATPDLSSLVENVGKAGLTAALSDETAQLTVFAPKNAAFDAVSASLPSDLGLLANILLHHVVPGVQDSTAVTGATEPFTTLAKTTLDVDGTSIDGAALDTNALDIDVSNGVVHLLDDVMLPPTALQFALDTPDASNVVTAVGQASAAVGDTLGGAEPITVFVPVNSAWGDLDPSTLDEATATSVLTYHVASGQVLSGDLSNGMVVTTVQGGTFTIDTSGDTPVITDAMDNTANIIDTDYRLLNGVVHLIDGVLMPN